MQTTNICPCPNLECPNHGDCENCTSRHLRIRSLNYCAFYSILNELEGVINAEPDSLSAQMIRKRIERQTNTYLRNMKEHGLSEENRHALRMEKTKLSKH
jgi:hypothetical protein